ncbi:MAG: PIN domain-containing protein [Pseudonocardiaceae bacterium]
MIGYCLDTDVISAVLKPAPPLHLIRRLAVTPAECQFTTAITVGELIYGAARRRNAQLSERVQHLIHDAGVVLPFDEVAAHTYGDLRATLEQAGQPLAEPDLRIASIALANELTVVTGNVRHFARVPGLVVENWLEEP